MRLLTLIEFTDEAEYVEEFLALPLRIYAGDKRYRGTSSEETLAWLRGQHCTGFLKQKNLLVTRDGVVLTRGIAFVNTRGGFGSIGFFESMDDPEAVEMLVQAASAFCSAEGMTRVLAPMDGSIWSSYRLMTRGFNDEPFLGEPYNKPYYADLLVHCGFTQAKTWETQFVKKVRVRGATARKFLSADADRKSRGITIRAMKNFDTDIRIIHKLAMNSFREFFCFHEVDEQEFVDLYSDLKLIADKRAVRIAYDHDRPIGFGIALPDYRSTLGFLLRHAKRYVFLYLGTWQENGQSVYPQVGKAIVTIIMKYLYIRRKGYVRALMGEDAKTRGFSPDIDSIHEYAVYSKEVS